MAIFLRDKLSLAENIDPDNDGSRYAWGQNVGWINFKPSQGPGVTVTSTGLTGYAWGENIGWINLSPSFGGVTNDGVGNLSGYAWGENIGWINFAPGNGGVKIDPFTGLFSGWAWGENIGWINFSIGQGRIKTSFIAFNTPSGSNIAVSPPGSGTTITFSSVYSPGNTSVTTSSSGPAPPAGFQLGNPATYYDIQTTATYAPPVIVCITYNPAQYSDPSSLRLLHYENSTWVDVTTSNDLTNYRICGEVSSLSPFVVAQRIDNPPVIAAVSVNPSVLWQPNNKMVDVTVNYNATDDWDQPVCHINSVTSNEPISSSDYAVIDAHHLKLRAQRLGSGNGRIYTITITCTDTSGHSSNQTVEVKVPHDQGKK